MDRYRQTERQCYLADSIKPSFICGELSLKCVMLLQLALKVSGITVAFILSNFQLLIDPSTHLDR